MEQVGKYGAARFCIPALSEFDTTMRGLPCRGVCMQGGRSRVAAGVSDRVRIGSRVSESAFISTGSHSIHCIWGLIFCRSHVVVVVVFHLLYFFLSCGACKMYPDRSTFTGANSEWRSQSRPCEKLLFLRSFVSFFFTLFFSYAVANASLPAPSFCPTGKTLEIVHLPKGRSWRTGHAFFFPSSLSLFLFLSVRFEKIILIMILLAAGKKCDFLRWIYGKIVTKRWKGEEKERGKTRHTTFDCPLRGNYPPPQLVLRSQGLGPVWKS